MSADDLKGKIALVTGASRGIGKGICLGLAESGANVVATVRTEEARQNIFSELESFESKSVIVDCDVETGLAINIKNFIYGGELKNSY